MLVAGCSLAPTPTQATRAADGAQMVYVPASEFFMGGADTYLSGKKVSGSEPQAWKPFQIEIG